MKLKMYYVRTDDGVMLCYSEKDIPSILKHTIDDETLDGNDPVYSVDIEVEVTGGEIIVKPFEIELFNPIAIGDE